jgi:hypothetical protein
MQAQLLAQQYISQPDYDLMDFSVEEGNSTGTEERCRCLRALPAKQRDGSSRSTAAASQCWRHENDEQFTVDSQAYSRAAATLVRGGTLPLFIAQSVRRNAWRNQGV